MYWKRKKEEVANCETCQEMIIEEIEAYKP